MARNIEIKARIASVEALLPRIAAIASEGPIEIAQRDTSFQCEAGRLMLGDFLNGNGELIFYRRANQLGPNESFYLRSVTEPHQLLEGAYVELLAEKASKPLHRADVLKPASQPLVRRSVERQSFTNRQKRTGGR